jgi:hypothetical protein
MGHFSDPAVIDRQRKIEGSVGEVEFKKPMNFDHAVPVEELNKTSQDPTTAAEPQYPMVTKPKEEAILDLVNDTKKKGGYVIYTMQPRRPGFGLGVPVVQAACAHLFPTTNDNFTIPRTASGSLLTFCFNRMLADFWTVRKKFQVDYVAMIHDDIGAPMCWADFYIEIMKQTGADFVSGISPIKDKRGLTSTALETDNSWSPRRLTMHEIFEKPETFTDPKILANTGLWLAKADAIWMGKFCFEQKDQIMELRQPNGESQYIARTISEDWDWSRKVKMFGGSIFVTRKVPFFHENPEFTNERVWGDWKTDLGDAGKEEYIKKMNNPGVPD